MNNILRPKKLNQCFMYIRRWFIYFLDACSKRKLNIKLLLASIKTITNINDWSGSRGIISVISVPAFLSDIG
jgi:hypothetical protein